MSENKHTNLEGLKEILEQRASLNWGLPKSLKESFPSIVGVKRIIVDNNMLNNICSEWIAGFHSPMGSWI
jgi:hypothetical protein